MFPAAPTGLIYPGDTNMNDGLRPSSTKFFETRVGVAYQPKNMPRTSFHAAFGLFSAPVPYSDYNHVGRYGALCSGVLTKCAVEYTDLLYWRRSWYLHAQHGQAIADT